MKYFIFTVKLLSRLLLVIMLLPQTPGLSFSEDPSPGVQPLTSSIQISNTTTLPDMAGCGDTEAPVINSDYELAIVELVNQERASEGLPPLERIANLDSAARYHSTDLGQDDYFNHDSYDRSGDELFYSCSVWTRIGSYYNGARGENIAAGYGTPESVMNAWMNSPGHRSNILSASNWEIGIGYYEGSGSYSSYWTQDFGRRNGVYPVVINNDAQATNDPVVNLYIYGDWSELRLRNDMEAWTAWQPFQNALSWELLHASGERTVTVEMRTGDQVTTSYDTIDLSIADSDPQLCALTDTITFTYDLKTQQLFPTYTRLTPENVGSSDPLEWEIEAENYWFTITPTLGTTPDPFTITPNKHLPPTELIDQGTITLTVVSPAGVDGSPHVISVSMKVISGTLRSIYIPLLLNLPP